MRFTANAKRHKGSMLVLSCMVGILLVVGIVFMYDLLSAYINHQLLNDRADRLALEAAAKFNEGDRANRINHLIIQSRELIFRSRQNYDTTINAQPFNHLQSLADRLLQQSRDGARLLERERARLVNTRLDETVKRLKQDSQSTCGICENGGQLLDEVAVGIAPSYLSGVPAVLSDADLREEDLSRNYIDKASRLYRGEINAKLPDQDEDLIFRVCALPGEAKQSALQKNVDYKPYQILLKDGAEQPLSCQQMPAVVRVKIRSEFSGLLIRHSYTLSANATATTAGPAFR